MVYRSILLRLFTILGAQYLTQHPTPRKHNSVIKLRMFERFFTVLCLSNKTSMIIGKILSICTLSGVKYTSNNCQNLSLVHSIAVMRYIIATMHPLLTSRLLTYAFTKWFSTRLIWGSHDASSSSHKRLEISGAQIIAIHTVPVSIAS